MNNSKNPYIILGLDPIKEYSDDEIKKAYHKNVLKYHPDKNKSDDAAEKFIEIHTAYEILSTNKTQYDSFNIEQKNEFYYIIKNSIAAKYPNFNNYLDFFTSLFYNSENDFKDEILNNDFSTIYSSFIKKLPIAVSKFNQQLETLKENYHKNILNTPITNNLVENNDLVKEEKEELDLDIVSSISCSLVDKIKNKHRKILVKRDTRDDIILYVPLRKHKMVFKGDGEMFNDRFGDIVINIHCYDEKDKLKIIDNKHVLYKINIDVYDYLFGGNKEVIIGNDIINFNLIPLSLDFIFINDKGIPDDDNIYGNLIISPYLKDYSNLKNDIMKLCKN